MIFLFSLPLARKKPKQMPGPSVPKKLSPGVSGNGIDCKTGFGETLPQDFFPVHLRYHRIPKR